MKDKKRKIRGSYATYLYKNGCIKTDLNELSDILANWGDTTRYINDLKAQELSLLAINYKAFYRLNKIYRKN